jgi:meso-butanediol dehydrogenase/(S,S)-butanediol dehydrogenase/diacetyl reductase
MLKDPKTVEKFNARMPLRKREHPDDIAGPVLFLASDDARKITDVILRADGGVMASNRRPA